ncbi:MAG: hypothetical protein ACPGOV_16000 [Magnetovibrionaceae bacterium]
MKKLPYTARTGTGDVYQIAFPLHQETGSAVDVENILSAVLATIDREVGVSGGRISNGDVLQAVAMAMAIRSGMIAAPHATTSALSQDLLAVSLGAFSEAEKAELPAGHA